MSAQSSQPSRRQRLRQATRAAHTRLDAAAGNLDLTEFEHYRRFLQANGAGVLAAEALLERAGVERWLGDWSLRRRADDVRADLAGLDAEPTPLSWDRPLPSPAELFGIVYVLEGSRLGARFLLPRVRASADARVRANVRFLSPQSAHLWTSFLEQLELAAPAADVEALVAGARAAFALFERSFSLVLDVEGA